MEKVEIGLGANLNTGKYIPPPSEGNAYFLLLEFFQRDKELPRALKKDIFVRFFDEMMNDRDSGDSTAQTDLVLDKRPHPFRPAFADRDCAHPSRLEIHGVEHVLFRAREHGTQPRRVQRTRRGNREKARFVRDFRHLKQVGTLEGDDRERWQVNCK